MAIAERPGILLVAFLVVSCLTVPRSCCSCALCASVVPQLTERSHQMQVEACDDSKCRSSNGAGGHDCYAGHGTSSDPNASSELSQDFADELLRHTATDLP